MYMYMYVCMSVPKRRRTAEAHLEVCPWCETPKVLVDAGWEVRYCAECNDT